MVAMAAVWRMTFDRFAPIPPEDFLAAYLDLIHHGIKKSWPTASASCLCLLQAAGRGVRGHGR